MLAGRNAKSRRELEAELAARAQGKRSLHLVVAGHVDAGKSTTMGRLLFELGDVSDKVMKKFERDSQRLGKSSFAFAWVLDETDEERSRGVTINVATRRFETPHKVVTLLDAPGHRDFVPNMIGGAAQADAAILVINATTGEFEAGFDNSGQTREHALLLRSLGVEQLIVAVNKMDTAGWSKERFDEIENRLAPFLKQTGFRETRTWFLPCAGYVGENLVKRAEPKLTAWYTGPTLVELIDALESPPRAVERPLRLSVTDVFKGTGAGGTVSVSGKVDTGVLGAGDTVLVMPLREGATVKATAALEIHGTATRWAIAGENVVAHLDDIDRDHVSVGQVLCDAAAPATVASLIRAQIVVFDVDVPILPGAAVLVHHHSVNEPATVRKLIATLNKSTGQVIKEKPRFLPKHCSATVEIQFARPTCLEVFAEYRELGRFVLRTGHKTIAAGIVQEILR